jgi:hypothetical protein
MSDQTGQGVIAHAFRRTHLSTTTTGDSDRVTTMSAFHIMRAEKTTIIKFSS